MAGAVEYNELPEDLKEQMKALQGEIVWLLHSRGIYRDLFSIEEENPAIDWDNPLTEWSVRNYAHSTLMHVRRLLDDHRIKHHESLSMVKFIERLPECEEVRELAVQAKKLKHDADRVLRFADKVVAHHDLHQPAEPTQIADLHKAIDDIVEFFENQLLAVLPGSGYFELKETRIIPRRLWDDILRKPWIPSGGSNAGEDSVGIAGYRDS